MPLPAPTKLRSSLAIEHATGPFKPHFARFYKKSDEAIQVYRFSAPEVAVHGGQIMSALSAACHALEGFQGTAHTFADQAQVMIKGLRKTCPINDDTPLNYFTATTHAADIPDDLLFEMFDNRNRGKQAASSNAKPPKPQFFCEYRRDRFQVTSTCAPAGNLSDTLISYLKHFGMADLKESQSQGRAGSGHCDLAHIRDLVQRMSLQALLPLVFKDGGVIVSTGSKYASESKRYNSALSPTYSDFARNLPTDEIRGRFWHHHCEARRAFAAKR